MRDKGSGEKCGRKDVERVCDAGSAMKGVRDEGCEG